MKDLMFVFAEIMPEEFLLKEIEDRLVSYRMTGDIEEKEKATMSMVLLLAKEASEQAGGIDKMIEKSDRMQQGYDLLTPKAS